MQAEYFRDFLARERRELVSDLSAHIKRLTVSMTTGSAGDVRQIRRCIRVTETEIRAIDHMVAALNYRFPTNRSDAKLRESLGGFAFDQCGMKSAIGHPLNRAYSSCKEGTDDAIGPLSCMGGGPTDFRARQAVGVWRHREWATPPRCKAPFWVWPPRRRAVSRMNELEQLARDVREYAIEVRRLGYSSAAGGLENQFLELSDRMIRRADNLGTGTVHGYTKPVL
jgi:hypothetical protein